MGKWKVQKMANEHKLHNSNVHEHYIYPIMHNSQLIFVSGLFFEMMLSKIEKNMITTICFKKLCRYKGTTLSLRWAI